ncbi:MAG: geranylgeranyl reductase family protein [Actinomycetota bacterium]|nr:geranylgeranyl reductase family protein [Actinomycetota bacterium]
MVAPEVVVVGGGPSGSSVAYWLARRGHSVVLAEKKEYPREKTCGDGLTPRAIYELSQMGFDFSVPELHRIEGLRSYAGERKLELPWPEHPTYPNWGGMIRRADLDAQVAALVEKQGVVVRQKATATPVIEEGLLAGVRLAQTGDEEVLRSRMVVIADGSLSRFGWELGTHRDKSYPLGLATRGYFTSSFSKDRFLESHLDVRDPSGASIPGYGWVFPLGDGTVNVGAGVLSTANRWKGVNTSALMESFLHMVPDYWGVSPETAISEPRGGKLNMGLSVGPRFGPNWVVVGDAGGAINPFTGEGIAYAYETGRMAAHYIHEALVQDDFGLLARYGEALEAAYGLYYKMGRIFVKAISRPSVMRALVHTGLRSRPLMEWVLRVMANLVDPEDPRVGEQAYRMIERMVRVAR